MLELSDLLARLLLAVFLGGLFGLERERRHKKAGLRTNIMVACGSALVMIISISFKSDPEQIAAGVITGIGFLGAGLIIQSQGEVHGVTTAATIWVVSAVGMAAGMGYYSAAIASTAVGLGVLSLLGTPTVRKIVKLND